MGSKLFKKKRGKFDEIREQRKRRRGEVASENALAKRRKLNIEKLVPEDDQTPGEVIENEDSDYIAFEDTAGEWPPQDEAVFYGLLVPEEQTYYSNVNSKIVANDFESEEDRQAFISAVYRESEGKELKLASSQSCSRYLEKVIMLSTQEQLRSFFGKLLGNLTHLVQHRFGSHVCETLFLESARHVTKAKEGGTSGAVTMESLFLQAVEELQPNIGFMLTDRFASHTIRALLLVFSGEPLDDASMKALLASKKKEKLDTPIKTETESTKYRNVPKSFKMALSNITNAGISSLDATYLQALATHPTGNPVLQLLLRLELANSDKGRQLNEGSLYYKLISPNSIEEGGEGAKFVSGLTYDSAGSHLIEVLVVHSPGRTFKKLYKNVWKDKMASMAKHNVASHVAMRILERLGKDDLSDARDLILPELPELMERQRTFIIKCLVDRSVIRELDLEPLAKAINEACGEKPSSRLPKLLGLEKPTTEAGETNGEKRTPKADAYGSLLAQSMIQAPDLRTLIQESLLAVDTGTLLQLSRDPAASRVVQLALTSSTSTIGYRKQMIPKYYDHVVELAKHPFGSYLVDTLWSATKDQHFMKERIAGELAAHETELRDSHSGRNVWRNWSMDIYRRRPAEWRALAKTQGEDGASEKPKTAFQLAQERHINHKHQRTNQSPNSKMFSANT